MQQPEHRQRCFRREATEATLLDVEIWKPRYRDLPCRSPPMRLYRSSGKHTNTDKDHTYNVSSTAHIYAHHFFSLEIPLPLSLSLSRSRSRCLSYCAFTSPPQKKKRHIRGRLPAKGTCRMGVRSWQTAKTRSKQSRWLTCICIAILAGGPSTWVEKMDRKWKRSDVSRKPHSALHTKVQLTTQSLAPEAHVTI
jgi:hypothetical protein